MEYRSPVRLVLHTGESPDPYSLQAISRARKKLLAELALTGDELVIEGISYIRNDLVTLLDTTSSEASWPLHCYVYAHPALLQFLEESTFNAQAFSNDGLHNTPQEIREALSPYFASAFNESSREYLRAQNFGQLQQLLTYQGLISMEDSPEAYRYIRSYFDDLSYTVRNMSWEKFSADKSVLDFLYDPHFPDFMNELPSLFYQERDQFVWQMILLVERFQKKAKWSLLQKICARLQKIECSVHIESEVNKFEAIMRSNANPLNRFRFAVGRGGWAGIWILFTLVRIFMNDGCNSSSRNLYSFNPNSLPVSNEIELPKMLNDSVSIRFKMMLDSLGGKKNTGTPVPPINGQSPFSFGQMPQESGNAHMTITNKSGADMILFYFPYWQTIADTSDRLFSVFIRQDSTLTLPIEALSSTRLNFTLGEGWVHLKSPIHFYFPRVDSTAQRQWLISDYFHSTPVNQPYLNNDLILTMSYLDESTYGLRTFIPVYIPDQNAMHDHIKNVDLMIKKKDGRVLVVATGNMYLYVSTEQIKGVEKIN